jgi:hypothetical protein
LPFAELVQGAPLAAAIGGNINISELERRLGRKAIDETSSASSNIASRGS